MRTYFKVTNEAIESVGHVMGSKVTVVKDCDREMINGVDEQLTGFFTGLNRAGLNASVAFRLNSGGTLLILDSNFVPFEAMGFVYNHELGHIRLGHQVPESAEESLAAELAADSYAADRCGATEIKAAAGWLLNAITVVMASHKPDVPAELVEIGCDHLRRRAQALEKRLKA